MHLTLLLGTGFASASLGSNWVMQIQAIRTAMANTDLLWHNTTTNQIAVWKLEGTTLLNGTDFVS